MKTFLRIFSFISVVIMVSVTMAILSSSSQLKRDEENKNVYVLDKNSFYDSLDFLEENAVTSLFTIDVAESIKSKKAAKYARADKAPTITSSLTTIGFVPASAPEKIAGGNIILTAYKEKNPVLIESEDARQAKVFTELIAANAGITISEQDIEYLKMATAPERLKQVNLRTKAFGIEITSDLYREFNDGDKKDRIELSNQFLEKYGITPDKNSVEKFVEEYSQFPGVPPIN